MCAVSQFCPNSLERLGGGGFHIGFSCNSIPYQLVAELRSRQPQARNIRKSGAIIANMQQISTCYAIP